MIQPSSLLLPSALLPSIRQIRDQSPDGLARLIDYLQDIYNPPVRASRRVKHKDLRKTLRDDEDAVEQLHADEFERAYAVRWLTGLISHASLLQESNDDNDKQASSATSYAFADKVDALIRSAAALIAICAGTSAARTLTRRYQFSSLMHASDIEVQVRDVPIAVDEDTPTVGTQTWGGARLLAEMIVEDPGRFGLLDDVLDRGQRVRVLELGAGTGLVSLALSRYLTARPPGGTGDQSNIEVVASDYHPLVLDNLRYNIKTNFPDGAPSGLSLAARALDWSTYSPPSTTTSSFEESFDLILGADVIYERAHAVWIRDCVAALLRRPTAEVQPEPRFHLVMPLRPTHTSESQMAREVFPTTPVAAVGSQKPARTDWELSVIEQETIAYEAEEGRGREEVEYVHYVIGWV